MVVGAFPAAKLGVLLLKQISKPIANALKVKAKDSQFFRQYICMPPAQMLNWWEVKAKMWSMNLGKPINVQPLNEAMAIELGANLLGEVIIFTIGAGVLILEYVRSSKKETTKEETALQEKRELKATLRELQFQAERQDAQIRELQRILAEVESKTWLPKNIFSRGENSQMFSSDPDIMFRAQETQRNTYYKEYPNKNVVFRALNLIETGFYFVDDAEAHEAELEDVEYEGGQISSKSGSHHNHKENEMWRTT